MVNPVIFLHKIILTSKTNIRLTKSSGFEKQNMNRERSKAENCKRLQTMSSQREQAFGYKSHKSKSHSQDYSRQQLFDVGQEIFTRNNGVLLSNEDILNQLLIT